MPEGYKCFDGIDVAGCGKPAKPPALQVQISRNELEERRPRCRRVHLFWVMIKVSRAVAGAANGRRYTSRWLDLREGSAVL